MASEQKKADLVERLNARADFHDADAWGPNNDTLCREASAELTRLRSLNAELVERVTEVVEVSRSGADTVSFLVGLRQIATKCSAALTRATGGQ